MSYDDLDGERLHDTCRQCHRTLWVRGDELQVDGPFVCDDCIRETVNRAAADDFARDLFRDAVLMARVRR